ncbi:MAG: right-handed parallel beta-helix repeat-containing protein [Sedimentisphaerales bacterium]|nr:right-handed parallel beta-helix repeat-containing protein [Sedimentisphaerales bacterium]
MRTTLLVNLIVCLCDLAVYSQAIHVDSNTGNDKNPGTKESPVHSIHKAAEIIRSGGNGIYTMKINPGIYVLDSHVPVSTEKEMTNKRIIIEASVLPDDPSWTPEKMPVIASKSKKGEIQESYANASPFSPYHFVVCFLIDESHVTIRGIKFHGYFYPNTRYFPIARFNKTKTDLLVEQCMFVGDENISHIQAGVIAHGDEVKIDHCVFYKVNNAIVFWKDSGNGIKSGNGITNSIIYGAKQGIWTTQPDKDFEFENNIISNCKHVWVKLDSNKTNSYSINNCVIVNNEYYKVISDSTGTLAPGEFEIKEKNVTKNGEISLRLADRVDKPLPIDYMHAIPNTLGYEIGAGIFKHRK